jgi:hypothetical protein
MFGLSAGGRYRVKRLVFLFILAAGLVSGLSADSVRFVVIGDTQPTFLKREYAVFEREIEQINALRPDLVINLGDMIRGYGLSRIEKEWEQYDRLAARIDAPFYRIPGNHDIFGRTSEKIYQERYGKGFYSVDVKGCHFIMLNNLEGGVWGQMGSGQIEWLKKDLDASSGKVVFVFVHIPVWYPRANHVDKRWRDLWMTEIHPLLREHGVEAVFAGHFHRFGPIFKADGITYYISGGGGARLTKVYAENGGVHHFLFAEVWNGKLSVDVITPSSVLSAAQADVVKAARIVDDKTIQAIVDFKTIERKHLPAVPAAVSSHDEGDGKSNFANRPMRTVSEHDPHALKRLEKNFIQAARILLPCLSGFLPS